MIELLNLILQLLVFVWIFSFPLNTFGSNSFFYQKELSIYDKYSINIIFWVTIYLILSFFLINLKFVFIINLILPLFFFFYKKIEIKNINNTFLVFLLINLSLFSVIASDVKLEWDGQAGWIYRVLNFYQGFSFENLKNVPADSNYPHLGSYLWAFFWKNSLFDHEYTGRLIFVFIFLLSIFSIFNPKKITDYESFVLIFLIIFLSYDKYLFSGYQEYLTFSFLIFFFKLFFLEKKNLFLFLIMLMAGNALMWFKNEGLVFFCILILSFFIKKPFFQKKNILLFFFASLLVLNKVIIFNYFNDNFYLGWSGYKSVSLHNLFNFDRLFERTLPIIISILVGCFKYPIIIIFLLLYIFSCIHKKKIHFDSYIIFFILNIALIFYIYYFTSYNNWKVFMSQAVDRLLFQTMGIYIFYIKEQLKFFRLKIKF